MHAKWAHFHQVPGILLVRLMSRCNERCLFCMVEDEIHGSRDVPLQQAYDRIDRLEPGTIVEFFGGEPTIYPFFLELLKYSRERGFDCSIASNCRIFHNQHFSAKVAALGARNIYVRTSLYGHRADIHDFYTATPRSFEQTIRGIKNLSREGILCQVNIVIMRRNFIYLPEIVETVHATGVSRIKFGNLISVLASREHAVPLSEVRPHLVQAIEQAEELGLSVTVEKTPICVAGGRIDLISTEMDVFGGSRVHQDNGACAGCLVRRWCDGFDSEYVELYGFDGIRRLDDVPDIGIHSMSTELPEPELLKSYCIRIKGSVPDGEEAAAINRVIPQVQLQHARLAIFPCQYLRRTQPRHGQAAGAG